MSSSTVFLGTEKNEGILPRSLSVIFNSIEGRVSTQMNLKPQRCREFTRLSSDEQNEEAAMKRGLFKLLKEVDTHTHTHYAANGNCCIFTNLIFPLIFAK